MEHYRSTLATTAIAVFGLVVAAHTLHPGNYEVQTRPARPISAPVAWTDPPARIAGPETTGAIRRAAEAPSALPSAVPAPQLAAVTPPVAAPALPLPREMADSAEPLPKASAVHRVRGSERNVRRVARLRHARTAQVDRAAIAPPAARPAQAAPDSATRIDPIGDIIRGLGFGRDS
ncbi:MAG: hypothetical protein MIL41_11665 [Hyphomicrobiales bacterium]|jgi:hypothetical protein